MDALRSRCRCVVLSDGQGNGTTCWEQGSALISEIEDVRRVSGLDELGLEGAPIGVSVWEGEAWYGRGPGPWEDSFETRGVFRDPTEQEWAAIRERRSPWVSSLFEDGRSAWTGQ